MDVPNQVGGISGGSESAQDGFRLRVHRPESGVAVPNGRPVLYDPDPRRIPESNI